MLPRRLPLSCLLGAALTLGLAGWMPAPLRATGAAVLFYVPNNRSPASPRPGSM